MELAEIGTRIRVVMRESTTTGLFPGGGEELDLDDLMRPGSCWKWYLCLDPQPDRCLLPNTDLTICALQRECSVLIKIKFSGQKKAEMEGEPYPVFLVTHRKSCPDGHWFGENHKATDMVTSSKNRLIGPVAYILPWDSFYIAQHKMEREKRTKIN